MTRQYRNPVVRGYFPDPSMVRVGDDYYLVNSSFQYFPAIPIHHSKDLVHWEIIGHAIVDNEYLNLSDIADSHGIWAPDISYHNGKFYIFAPFRLNNAPENETGRLRVQLVMTADRPEGPYSKPSLIEVDSIDPSHFVDDDGTHYMITAPGISVTRLSEDCSVITKPTICVWKGTNRAPEGPHVFKKDGWYYAVLAEGGTGYGHRISVARSHELYGEYEVCPYNPVMTQKDPDAEIQRCGHGKLVQTQNGDWWAMYLCSRQNGGQYTTLGRETALDPVTWTDDGWFVINGLKGPSAVQDAPNLPETVYEVNPLDDFDGGALDLRWEFVRNPKNENWSLTDRKGWLRLRGCVHDLCERRAYNTLVQRETEHFFEASLKLDYSPDKNRQEAGLVSYYGVNNYIKLCKCCDNVPCVRVIANNNGEIKTLGDAPLALSDGLIYLKLVVERQKRSYFYSLDNKNWVAVAVAEDCTFLCDEGVTVGKHHTGTLTGVYSFNPAYSYVDADFDWFLMKSTVQYESD